MSACIELYPAAEEFLRTYPSSNLYLLLDHSGLPGLNSKLWKSSLKWTSLFDLTLEANALRAAPILVLIGSNGELKLSRHLRDWIEENGAYTSAVLMLSSPLQLSTLARRLAARLHVKLSDDTDAMLRFFDPRIFENLTRTLSPEQSRQFFSSAEAWQYVNRAGKLVRVNSKFELHENFALPLALSQSQEFSLLDASEVDQVLELIQSNVPTLLARIPKNERYQFAVEKIKSARMGGVDSVYKFAIYITVILIKGEEFIGSGSWERFMTDLGRDDIDLSESLLSEA